MTAEEVAIEKMREMRDFSSLFDEEDEIGREEVVRVIPEQGLEEIEQGREQR